MENVWGCIRRDPKNIASLNSQHKFVRANSTDLTWILMVPDEELMKIVDYINSNIDYITHFFTILADRLHGTSKISQYGLISLL